MVVKRLSRTGEIREGRSFLFEPGMLPKCFRLKDASLFQKAFRGGKPFFFEKIACKAIFIEGERKRVGFAIPKKVFPKAVDRNRAKRALSDAVSLSFGEIPDGWNIVFFPRDKDFFWDDSVRRGVSVLIRKIKDIKG
jgi:ribonuclease P protein component